MSQPIQGSWGAVSEGYTSAQFVTADGRVNMMFERLDPLPREGESVDFGTGEVFVVEHVRWMLSRGGWMTSGRAVARIILRSGAPNAPSVPHGQDLR